MDAERSVRGADQGDGGPAQVDRHRPVGSELGFGQGPGFGGRQILGLPTYSVAGFSMRPVKLCSGGYICDNNVRDSFSLGLTLDKKFSGRRLPFKMIISVSGCSRSCSEPLVKDIGVVASKEGYSLFVGGAAGRKPRIAQRLLDNLNEQEVIHAVERIVSLYEKKGRTPERLGIFIEKMGLEKFREECGLH